MKIPEIQHCFEQLGIDRDTAVVVGSGILDVMGIRASDDLDVLVPEAVFQAVAGKGHAVSSYANGAKYMRIGEVEVMDDWFGEAAAVRDRAVVIDGVRFMSLEDVRAWKIRLGRPKDVADVALIDAYVSTQQGTQSAQEVVQ